MTVMACYKMNHKATKQKNTTVKSLDNFNFFNEHTPSPCHRNLWANFTFESHICDMYAQKQE